MIGAARMKDSSQIIPITTRAWLTVDTDFALIGCRMA